MQNKTNRHYKITFSSFLLAKPAKECILYDDPGADGEAETHVPIPNTVVKGFSGDGTVYLTAGE